VLLQGKDKKDNILKKRSFSEFFNTQNFESGGGRRIDKWIIHKSHLFEDETTAYKRIRLAPARTDSFALKHLS
jgi:hypothetical protein